MGLSTRLDFKVSNLLRNVGGFMSLKDSFVLLKIPRKDLSENRSLNE